LYERASRGFEMVLGQNNPATIECNNHYNALRQEMLGATEDPLLKGWEERKTQDGQVYFVDHNTKSTTWVRPDLREAAGMLPEGWEERQTCEGKPYFVNHITKSTSWIHPDHHCVTGSK
jgi:hypothetical protein